MRFELPSACAESVRIGTAAFGLVPVIEAFRQNLERVSDLGIASDGPVRSIFLIHRTPVREIRSLALDPSSRTSVALARIILLERYGVTARERMATPGKLAMLEETDAAVLIGDPALQFETNRNGFGVLDLGSEWKELTGLPMVYAVWAGHSAAIPESATVILRHSYEFGMANLDEIIRREGDARHIPTGLARQYLTQHIHYELEPPMMAGLKEFERLAREHGLVGVKLT